MQTHFDLIMAHKPNYAPSHSSSDKTDHLRMRRLRSNAASGPASGPGGGLESPWSPRSTPRGHAVTVEAVHRRPLKAARCHCTTALTVLGGKPLQVREAPAANQLSAAAAVSYSMLAVLNRQSLALHGQQFLTVLYNLRTLLEHDQGVLTITQTKRDARVSELLKEKMAAESGPLD